MLSVATVGRVTAAPPAEDPKSGPAVEQPPHREDDQPRTLVYKRPRPELWVFWPSWWQHAEVWARQDYRSTDEQPGRTVYQVELYDDPATHSKVVRTFLWGPDSLRPVVDDET